MNLVTINHYVNRVYGDGDSPNWEKPLFVDIRKNSLDVAEGTVYNLATFVPGMRTRVTLGNKVPGAREGYDRYKIVKVNP